MTVNPQISEWGNPSANWRISDYIGGEPGELKHLITRRKRKQ